MSEFDLRPRVPREPEWHDAGWFRTVLWCIWPGLPILFLLAMGLTLIMWAIEGAPIAVNPIDDCPSIECVEQHIENEAFE